jgi:hypothetical protein
MWSNVRFQKLFAHCKNQAQHAFEVICHNPGLRFATKTRACKVAGQERKPRNERKCEGMNPHTPKGASTLGVGVPVDS